MFNASFHALPFNPEQNCRLVKGNHQPSLLFKNNTNLTNCLFQLLFIANPPFAQYVIRVGDQV